VLADAVSITVGYHNYGPTNDAAYAENMRVADRILKGWIDALVPENQISTHSLSIERVSDNDLKETDAADRKQRQWEATQGRSSRWNEGATGQRRRQPNSVPFISNISFSPRLCGSVASFFL